MESAVSTARRKSFLRIICKLRPPECYHSYRYANQTWWVDKLERWEKERMELKARQEDLEAMRKEDDERAETFRAMFRWARNMAAGIEPLDSEAYFLADELQFMLTPRDYLFLKESGQALFRAEQRHEERDREREQTLESFADWPDRNPPRRSKKWRRERKW